MSEQLPTQIAILVMGDALGLTSERGYIVAYDLEGRQGRGEFLLSEDPLDAQTWPSIQAALQAYSEQSRTVPLRDDGMPNRPMRTFTVQLVGLDANIVRQRLAQQKGH